MESFFTFSFVLILILTTAGKVGTGIMVAGNPGQPFESYGVIESQRLE